MKFSNFDGKFWEFKLAELKVTNNIITGNPYLLTVVFLLTVIGSSFAQRITPQVFNVVGFTTNLENTTISSSIGELATSTIATGDLTITQGFLQPIERPPCLDLELIFFPNPVTDVISVGIENCPGEIGRIEVYDIFGKRVHSTKLVENSANLSTLSPSVYIIKAITTNEEVAGSFKVAKVAK